MKYFATTCLFFKLQCEIQRALRKGLQCITRVSVDDITMNCLSDFKEKIIIKATKFEY